MADYATRALTQDKGSEVAQPFEDLAGVFFALRNDEGQHSLWPSFAPVPAGWAVVFGPEKRGLCIEFIEEAWVDMRPNSLVLEANKGRREN